MHIIGAAPFCSERHVDGDVASADDKDRAAKFYRLAFVYLPQELYSIDDASGMFVRNAEVPAAVGAGAYEEGVMVIADIVDGYILPNYCVI